MPKPKQQSGAWAKVPRAILSRSDLANHPLRLRLLIALLSYADPRVPDRVVYPSPRRLAQDLALPGLGPAGRQSRRRVRATIGDLQRLGYIIALNAPGRYPELSLQPTLALAENQGRLAPEEPPEVIHSVTAAVTLRDAHRHGALRSASRPNVDHTNGSDQLIRPSLPSPPCPRPGAAAGQQALFDPDDLHANLAEGRASASERWGALCAGLDPATRRSVETGAFGLAPRGTDRAWWERVRRAYCEQRLRDELLITAILQEAL